jgi:hypothetical protein
MKKACLPALALACGLLCSTSHAQYADSVISYTPGTGAGTYVDSSRILGSPSTWIGYQNADPFNAPYSTNNLVAIGTGGSLTFHLSTAAQNDPLHAYGLDFLLFGHTGFVITNGDYEGGGITDGSLYAGGAAVTWISVSSDGVNFYKLDPAKASSVDGMYPTDASGNFQLPVNPNLTAADFAGKDLAGIRALYGGAAGGTGYDISWAQDADGHSVSLASINYVRVDVLSGVAYLDAASVVPEPTTWALGLLGAGCLALIRRCKA